MLAKLLRGKGEAPALMVFLAAAAIACLGACGPSDAERGSLPEGVTAVKPETSSSTSTGTWKTYAGKGFTVALPESWTAVGVDEDSPQDVLNDMPPEVRSGLASGDLFYALDASDDALERMRDGKLAASFSVYQGPVSPTSWRAFVRENAVPVEGASDFRASVVALPAGRALKVTYSGSGPPLNKQRSVIQYVLLPRSDYVFGLTMETAPELLNSDRATFDQIARRFGLAPP
jgi:hypothetical protein